MDQSMAIAFLVKNLGKYVWVFGYLLDKKNMAITVSSYAFGLTCLISLHYNSLHI